MTLNKLKTYNSTELSKEYKETQEKFKKYKIDLKSGKEKDSAKIKTLRKNVAQILTLLKQKEFELKEELVEVETTKEIKKKSIKK